jgi:hypothetical protein
MERRNRSCEVGVRVTEGRDQEDHRQLGKHRIRAIFEKYLKEKKEDAPKETGLVLASLRFAKICMVFKNSGEHFLVHTVDGNSRKVLAMLRSWSSDGTAK